MRYRLLQTIGFAALLVTLTVIHCLPTEIRADRRRSTTFLAAAADDDTEWSESWPEWDGATVNPELTDDHPTTGWPKTYGRMCVTFTSGPSGAHRTIIDSRTGPDDPRPYLSVVDDGRIRFGIPTVGSIEGGTVIPGQTHTACIDLTLGTTTLVLDDKTIGTSTTLSAWEWHPTTRLGSRYDGADPLGGVIRSIQWRGLRLVCDMRSDTCSDGRKITSTRTPNTHVPCEVFPGVWVMVGPNQGCYSVRGLEAWNSMDSSLSYGAELDRSPWQAVDGATVQSLPTGGYRVSGVGEESRIFQLITPGSGAWTFACVADTGASIGARLGVYQTGASGSLFCDLDSVTGFQIHSCTTNITSTPTELAVRIYPGSGHVDVVGCWLYRYADSRRPCWGGNAPVQCGEDRHAISTDGWPTESGEISLVYTPQAVGVSYNMWLVDSMGFQNSGFDLYRNYASGALVFRLRRRGDGTSSQSTQSLVWEKGRSYHIRVRWSPERAEIWRDGVLLLSWVPTRVPDSHSGTAYIGGGEGSLSRVHGSIRDLRIRSYEEVSP